MRLFPVLVIGLLAAVAVTALASRPRKADWDREARIRKADYVYVSGAGAASMDSVGTGLMMMDYARMLNPDDRDIASNYAMLVFGELGLDSAQAARLYAVISDAWFASPDDYDRGESVAEIAGKLGRYDDLVRVWTILDSLYPVKDDPAYNLAQAYAYRYIYTHDTADYNRSLDIYDRIERGTGRNLGLTSQRMRLYLLRGDTTAMDRELDSLLAVQPFEARAFLYAGAVFENRGKDSLALVNYRHAAELDSVDGLVIMQLARFYNLCGDSVAYDREVFRALENPGLPFDAKRDMLRGYLTDIYHDSVQWPRIERMFSVLQRVNGDEPDVHLIQGSFETVRGHLPQAREQFGYAVSLDPGNEKALAALMESEVTIDSTDAAIATGRRGVELFPDNFYFPIVTASLLREQNRFDEGIALLRSVPMTDVRNKKAVSNLLTALGDIYYSAGQPDSAFAVYERALSLDRENWPAYNNAAYFMAEKDRDLDRAERYASYACTAEPENPTYLDTYAWVLFKKRNYPKAAEIITKALNALVDVVVADTMLADEVADTVAIVADTVAAAVDLAPSDTDWTAVTMEPASVTPDQLAENQSWLNENQCGEIFSHAGDIYFMDGKPDAALAFWKKALKVKPDNELLQRKVKHKAYYYQ